MAQIQTDTVVITFSRLVKVPDNTPIISDEIQAALEQVAQELVGGAIIVEVTKA